MSSSRRWLWGAVQAGLAVAVAWLLWRTGVRYWDDLRAPDVAFAVRPGWIALAALVVFVTYGLLVEAWRRLILGWGQQLSFRDAVRIWTLANLGRYLPGKVWAIAGLAVLAQRRGVAAWAATGSALVMQGVALGTGAAVVVACLPGDIHAGWIAAATALAAVTVLLPVWPAAVHRVGRLLGREDLQPLRLGAVLASALAAALSWLAYGLAFWVLVRGVLPDAAITPPLAIGAFAAGYIVGLLAAFAPGGLGVREGVIGPLVAGALGGAGALVAVAAQRILLTATEGVAALTGYLLGGSGPTNAAD